VSIPSDVLFATNSATLGPNSQSALENVAHIAAQSRGPVCVVGYTDDTGSAAYNQALSIRRARAVVIGLVVLGVNSDRLGAEGEGEANPVASNVSGSGRAQNRRVEVLFTSCSTNG
jgi:outer membrane protein OmpA-like peptidoglycan-associated protein